jgi:hypothetical protein
MAPPKQGHHRRLSKAITFSSRKSKIKSLFSLINLNQLEEMSSNKKKDVPPVARQGY